MNDIETEVLTKRFVIERVLGHYKGKELSPTIVFFGGIHGNEHAGIIALKKVLQNIDNQNIKFTGNCYAISGNRYALEHNIRFNKVDLNRVWTSEGIDKINVQKHNKISDIEEQVELYHIIKKILSTEKGPFFFIDLHTTSSDTMPFITISDSLNNRKFASKFSVPIILGIEEYLEGPLLTFINEFGHIALGFEGGQHKAKESINNCEAFIWLALEASGCVSKKEINGFSNYKKVFEKYKCCDDFYEIDYRYHIKDDEDFKMNKGFINFDSINKGQPLAISNSEKITADFDGKIFMPLYQNQGEDGFFIITKISNFWLKLSTIVRKLKMHHLLRLLPGIKQDKNNPYILIVDPRTAKFMAVEIFHLFGYRKQVIKDNKLHFIKRDRKISEFY